MEDKKTYTAKERKELTDAIKLSDKVCATCNLGHRKDKGKKYACSKGVSKFGFETCGSYKRNSFLS